jgi:quinolinate synthase
MIIRPAAIHRLTTNVARHSISTTAAGRRLASASHPRTLSTISTTTRMNNRDDISINSNNVMNSTQSPQSPHRYLSTANAPATPSAPPAQQITSFPSLIIGPKHQLSPQGSFAEAQAAFLEPPIETVVNLLDQLIDLKVGIVAHYYMDVELQGVLHAVKRRQMELLRQQQLNDDSSSTSSTTNTQKRRIPEYPLVAIADSLKMGDDAVQMCSQSNVNAIICLGVDFMSESVSAIMGRNGYKNVPVYRATTKPIGCSLAESAEGDNYKAWLYKSAGGGGGGGSGEAEGTKKHQSSLHVVYINTSLETKAMSSSIMPTITCTSSNVLQTILQASAQIGPEELQICYGPDTYMGENLVSLLDAVLSSGWTDERIKIDLHPDHDRSTIQALRNNMNVYPSGNCVVHHMFGQSVVETVLNDYADAYVTAHLEVPGEMFQIALRKSLMDEGVVGSTSNILNFIERKVEEAAKRSAAADVAADANEKTRTTRLKFILGTEAGMVTSIVRSVQDILESNACQNVEAEIIFPVSSEAVMGVDNEVADAKDGTNSAPSLEVVPGVAGGEGCSTAGGCATCPFMKMNDLDAVHDILDMIGQSSTGNNEWQLSKHLPPNRLAGKLINGRDAIDFGTEPIVYMREFMKAKRLSDALVERVKQGRRNVDGY